jgi:hypothetical protein
MLALGEERDLYQSKGREIAYAQERELSCAWI